MKSKPGRLWPVLAGFSIVLLVGCQESPPHKSSPGNLPGRLSVNEEEPQINAMTYFAHGHLLERQGNFERAVVQYRKALVLQPEFLSARNRLGITLNKLGRHEEATEQFRLVVIDHPAKAHLYNNLGFSLYLEEYYDEAEAALTQALELKPDYPRAHLNYALVLARLERFDEAYAELQQVGSTSDAYFNMGVMLTEAEKYAEAAHYLEAALTARPDFAAARHQLREVSRLAAEKEASQAAIMLALSAEQETQEQEETVVSASETPTDDKSAETPTDSTIDEELTEVVVEEQQTNQPAVEAAAEPAVENEQPVVVTQDPQAEEQQVEPVTDQVVEAEDDGEAMVSAPDWQAVDAEQEPGTETMTDATVAEVSDESWEPDWQVTEPVQIDGEQWTVEPVAGGYVELDPQWCRPEPGIEPAVLFTMIDEALQALHENHDDAFEELWCKVGYYLFPSTAPEVPESRVEWLIDQNDLIESYVEPPVGK